MKIAIGIAGHYKNFDITKNSLIELKNQYNADVYIHSYTTKSFLKDEYIKDKNTVITEEHYACLSPKKIILEDSSHIHRKKLSKIRLFKSIFKFTPVKEIDSQILSIRKRRKVLEIIGDNYDFIILIRPDTLILEPVTLNLKKLNIISLLDLYQDSLIAGKSNDIKDLILSIDKNFGIAINKGKFITCPHEVIKHYSKKFNVNLIFDAKVTLVPKDSDTLNLRKKQFNI